MNLTLLPFKKTLNKAYQKVKPNRSDMERFKAGLVKLLDRIDHEESEENHKFHLRDFLNEVWYKDAHLIAPKGKTDLVIHEERNAQSPAVVLFEVKRQKNLGDMIRPDSPNAKAMHELILYYLRERVEHGNTDIKHLVITNIYDWYIFDGATFDRLFYQNKKLLKEFERWRNDQKVQHTTEFFYKDIAKPFLETMEGELAAAHFSIRDFEKQLRNDDPKDDAKLIPLFKILSPQHLLRLPFANDSNTLNEGFYKELLYLIGLEEEKEGGKKLIRRCAPERRHPGSLLENTINIIQYEDRMRHVRSNDVFEVALELCITWVNRLLFLKLLESQLVKYHGGDASYRFLTAKTLKDFDGLNKLFFQVLAEKADRRPEAVKATFAKVPYLNSSLFEITDMESAAIRINSLEDELTLPVHNRSVLKHENNKTLTGSLPTLPYIFAFLDAYDFASEGSEEIQEENKALINASVLGLIFEKINGYKDGSFFTPGFITMYMCRETVRRAVVQKFNQHYGIDCTDFDDLRNYTARLYKKEDVLAMNRLVNSLRICDPAVGSGHFLVSALNELIAVKSELGILADREGVRLKGYEARVENDELIITCNDGQDLFEYRLYSDGVTRSHAVTNAEMQRVQETIFHEKQTIIENCLFGVDINPNSVKICRLRLWIELLKSTYYRRASDGVTSSHAVTTHLETLPNIDINIKSGNSLISRFALDADLSKALKSVKYDINTYRRYVQEYHHATDKETKRGLLLLIEQIKGDFRTEIHRNDKLNKQKSKLAGELYNLTQQGSLFGMTQAEAKKQQAETDKLIHELEKVEAQIQEAQDNKIYENAFEWRFEFPEVLDAEGKFVGFDVVVGNPPYIRIQDLMQDENLVKWYNSNYFSTGAGNYDLYIPFIELGFKLLANDGEQCFIMPHKFTNANYGEKIRELIVNEKSLRRLIHFGALQVFQDASTYTGLFFFDKSKNQSIEYFGCDDFAALDNDSIMFQKIPSDILTKDEWVFLSNKEADLLLKVSNNPSLEALTDRIFQGLKTSADKIYILEKLADKDEFYEILCRENEKKYQLEKSILFPLIKGGNSRSYQIFDTDLLILFPYKNGELITAEVLAKEYPCTWDFLNEHKSYLENRENGKMKGDKWYGYVYPKALKVIDKPKIFTPDIAPTPRISFDKEGDFMFTGGVSGGYGIVPKEGISSLYLLAILNSQVAFWYIKKTSTQMRGGWYSFESRYIKNIPIPHPVDDLAATEALVTQILSAKQADPQADTAALEREVDMLVYGLYGLTEEEVGIVEGV